MEAEMFRAKARTALFMADRETNANMAQMLRRNARAYYQLARECAA